MTDQKQISVEEIEKASDQYYELGILVGYEQAAQLLDDRAIRAYGCREYDNARLYRDLGDEFKAEAGILREKYDAKYKRD